MLRSCFLLLLACVALLPAADISLVATAGSGSDVVVTMHLDNASPFATAGALVRFDHAKLQLTTQAGGSFTTFIQDTRSLTDINASGEVRFGILGFSDNAGGNGTLGVFTFATIASGSASVTSVVESGSEPFGCQLQTAAGGTITPNLVGLPITVNAGPVNTAPSITSATATPDPVTGTQTALAVDADDDAGEPALTYHWSVHSAPVGATVGFSANDSNAAKSATATFDTAGSYTLRVAAIDVGPLTTTHDVAVTVDQTATTVVLTPTTLSVSVGGAQTFTAAVDDQFGAALATQPTITWTVDGGGVGSISAGGVYTASAVGSATVRATAGALDASAAVTVTPVNTQPTIATATATPNPVTGTQATLAVSANDDGGESALSYTWTAPTVPTGGGVTFAPNSSNAAKGAVATFTKAGAYTLRVTVSDGTLSATHDVAVTVAPTVTTVAVTPTPVSLPLGDTQAFTAVTSDQFGTALATQPAITWSIASGGVGSIATDGTYTASAAGSATVRATTGTIHGDAAVTVAAGNAQPTIASATATPNPVTGTQATLAVSANDDGGEPALTYTWSALTVPPGGGVSFAPNGDNTGKAAVAFFTGAGAYTLRVTVSDGTLSKTRNVAVTVAQTPTSVTVSPGTAALAVGETQTFAAQVLDQFGTALSTPPVVTWSLVSGGVGSIATDGVYTALAAGSASVRATAGALTAAAAVTVTSGSRPTIATATPDPVTGTQATLAVSASDDGGEPALTYTWSAPTLPAGGAVSFAPNGGNAGKAAVATFTHDGAYVLRVTVSDGTLSATHDVAVTVVQTPIAVLVTPGTAHIPAGGNQVFTAQVRDQFGINVAVPIVWSIDAGGVGTVTAGGSYTPPTAGMAVVRATGGGISGTATVTVGATLPPDPEIGDGGRGHCGFGAATALFLGLALALLRLVSGGSEASRVRRG